MENNQAGYYGGEPLYVPDVEWTMGWWENYELPCEVRYSQTFGLQALSQVLNACHLRGINDHG